MAVMHKHSGLMNMNKFLKKDWANEWDKVKYLDNDSYVNEASCLK